MTVSQTVTLGTSQYQDQADKQKELNKWEREQEKELKKMYSEEVEIVPSPLLLQEKEEAEGHQLTPVSPVSIPGRIHSSFPLTVSPTSTSSRRRCHRHKPSLSPTASEPSTSASAPVGPLSSAATPAAADFPAGFGSGPGRRRHHRTIAIGEVRTGVSNPTSEGPSAMASAQLLGCHSALSTVLQPSVQPKAQNWLQARLEKVKNYLMRDRCFSEVRHLMAHPEDLDLVHSILQAESLAEGWLDAPASVSAGGPFDPLLVAINASQVPEDPGASPSFMSFSNPKFLSFLRAGLRTEDLLDTCISVAAALRIIGFFAGYFAAGLLTVSSFIVCLCFSPVDFCKFCMDKPECSTRQQCKQSDME
ncbi:hypothetical protein CRENBAI_006522 [Crenichthys baileyi]|uniref:Transmembrane protein n=1 Tax=Crenichthys baileyi TaxID=28760 RepID=A0AAV9R8W3_9TELE